MARRALARVGTLQELSIVRVLVAVRALGELQRLFEIAVDVAGRALHRLVFSFQGVLRLGVIEILAQSLGDALPSQGGMTSRARLLEAAVVRVLVTVVALAEGDALVPRLAVGSGSVALLALDLLMLPGKRVARLRVIKFLRHTFPVIEIVTALAFLAEPSLVEIFVASGAGGRHTDEGSVQVLHLDQRTHARGNVFGGMALPAIHAHVLSFQHVARLFMIKGLDVPFHDREIHAVVVGVALDTLLAGAGTQSVGKVQSLVRIEASGDLFVTLQALEFGLSTRQSVAIGTMRSAVKILVCAGERARGDLGHGERGQQHQAEGQESRTDRHGSGERSTLRAVCRERTGVVPG